MSFVAALLAGVAGAASSALLGGGWLWLAHEAHALLRLRNWVSSYLAGAHHDAGAPGPRISGRAVPAGPRATWRWAPSPTRC